MMAIALPTAARVAATVAIPSSRWRGSILILSARNPSACSRSADSARAAGGRSVPHEAYTGRASAEPPNNVATDSPAT